MKSRKLHTFAPRFLLISYFLLISFLFPLAQAHVPGFEEAGNSPGQALYIEAPTKSRVFYGQLAEGGDSRYYSFNMSRGERILLSLIVPTWAREKEFVPSLVLLGPGLPEDKNWSEPVQAGSGAVLLTGSFPQEASYEGFTPSAFYSLAVLDLKAPESGTYYAGVYSRARGGNYALVVGFKETFTLKEWVLVPAGQVRTYLWEGESFPLIFAPMLLTLALGFLGLRGRKEKTAFGSLFQWTGAFASLFYLGTGISFLFQMLIALSKTPLTSEASITLILAFVNLGLGGAALRLALKTEKPKISSRISYIILGLAGLFFWAGWFAGPVLSFLTGLWPFDVKPSTQN